VVPRPGPRRHPRHLRPLGLARRPEGLREGPRDALRGALPAGLRRRPEDIAGWPEIHRILTPIGLDAEARELYARRGPPSARRWPSTRGTRPALRPRRALRLRQKSSLIRVEGTARARARAPRERPSGRGVGRLSRDPGRAARSLQAEGCVRRAARRAWARRARGERLRFQRGEARRWRCSPWRRASRCTRASTTTCPRSEVIHDLRWSAIQMAQIEGRCHRDGRFAQVYWAYADDTIEERIAAIVCRRSSR
jgi:hypothetical protein